ncbi:MAG: hypothetical protein E6Q83_11960 [Thiothrix sp.]|nr:MAG: hypothetical protein E6Q83_11960 [Thiothrix sp.]
MRIMVALVLGLYLLAALYGYYWWNDSHQQSSDAQIVQATTTDPSIGSRDQLRFPELKSSDVTTTEDAQALKQQIQSLQTSVEARLQELKTQQTTTLAGLQKQIDELKQQTQVLVQTQANPSSPNQATNLAPVPSTDLVTEPPPTEQLLENQVQQAKRSLNTQMSQLDLKLQTDPPDVARQSVFQQKMDEAFTQAQLSNLLQTRAECGQTFCKLEIQGQVPAGVDPLQTLWEQNVFPESTQVMTVPKTDGSGWLVYIAAEGQSLKLP